MSIIALKIAAVLFVLATLGYFVRKRWPRLALFLMSLAIISVGVWGLVSTYELSTIGRAHVISRHSGSFSRADNPSLFDFSFWFHIILAGFVTVLGIAGVVFSFIKKNFVFTK